MGGPEILASKHFVSSNHVLVGIVLTIPEFRGDVEKFLKIYAIRCVNSYNSFPLHQRSSTEVSPIILVSTEH